MNPTPSWFPLEPKLLRLPLTVASLALLKLKGLSFFQIISLFRLIQTLRNSGRFSFNNKNVSNTNTMSVSEAYKILNLNSSEKITKEDVGEYSSRSEENIGGINYTKIWGEYGGAMTVTIRGSTPEIRDEIGRAFDDALGVSHRLTKEGKILPGGGATQIHLARKLREYATTQSGREQMAIEGYAAALEIVPRTLAENAGYDPIDIVLSLSAAQSKKKQDGEWIGLNGNSGEILDMFKEEIFDPKFVVEHAITGATEAAISILRIDDVLWAKKGPETPDWSNQIEDN